MSKPTKKLRPVLRFKFPDGTTTDKLLLDVELSQADTDPMLARMTEDAPVSSAAAQVRIAERAHILVAARALSAKQSTAGIKTSAENAEQRRENKVASDEESVVVKVLAADRRKHKRDPKPADILIACQRGGWGNATVSNVSRVLKRIYKREAEGKR